MNTEKLIYMAHPVGGNVAVNRLRAMLWLKWLTIETGATVIAPWITDVALWDDDDPEARERGLQKCRTTLVRCDELWMVGGQGATSGMKREAAWALENGLKIVDASTMPAPWEWIGRTTPPRWDLSKDPMAQEIERTIAGRNKPLVHIRRVTITAEDPESHARALTEAFNKHTNTTGKGPRDPESAQSCAEGCGKTGPCILPRGHEGYHEYSPAAPRYPSKDTPSDALLAPEDPCLLCRIGEFCKVHGPKGREAQKGFSSRSLREPSAPVDRGRFYDCLCSISDSGACEVCCPKRSP